MTAPVGSLVIVLGVAPLCGDCLELLPDGEGVAGEVIAGRQSIVCAACASEGTAAHLFEVDERAAGADDAAGDRFDADRWSAA